MFTAKTLATLLGVSERTARRRLDALRADGAEVSTAQPTGRGRPRRTVPREAVAERLGLTVEDLAV